MNYIPNVLAAPQIIIARIKVFINWGDTFSLYYINIFNIFYKIKQKFIIFFYKFYYINIKSTEIQKHLQLMDLS